MKGNALRLLVSLATIFLANRTGITARLTAL